MDEEREKVDAGESISYNRPQGGSVDWGTPEPTPDEPIATLPEEPVVEPETPDVEPKDPEPETEPETPSVEPEVPEEPQEPVTSETPEEPKDPEPEVPNEPQEPVVNPEPQPEPNPEPVEERPENKDPEIPPEDKGGLDDWFSGGEEQPPEEVTGGTDQEGEQPVTPPDVIPEPEPEPQPEPGPEPEPTPEPEPEPTPEPEKPNVEINIDHDEVHIQDDHSQVRGDEIHVDIDIDARKDIDISVDKSSVIHEGDHVDKSTVIHEGDQIDKSTVINEGDHIEIHKDDHSRGDTSVVVNHYHYHMESPKEEEPVAKPEPTPEPTPTPEQVKTPESVKDQTTVIRDQNTNKSSVKTPQGPTAEEKQPVEQETKGDRAHDFFQYCMNLMCYKFKFPVSALVDVCHVRELLEGANPPFHIPEYGDAYCQQFLEHPYFNHVYAETVSQDGAFDQFESLGDTNYEAVVDYDKVKANYESFFGGIEGAPTADEYYAKVQTRMGLLNEASGVFGTEALSAEAINSGMIGMSMDDATTLLSKVPEEKMGDAVKALQDMDAATVMKYQSMYMASHSEMSGAQTIYQNLSEQSLALNQTLNRIVQPAELEAMTGEYISLGKMSFAQMTQQAYMEQADMSLVGVKFNDGFTLDARNTEAGHTPESGWREGPISNDKPAIDTETKPIIPEANSGAHGEDSVLDDAGEQPSEKIELGKVFKAFNSGSVYGSMLRNFMSKTSGATLAGIENVVETDVANKVLNREQRKLDIQRRREEEASALAPRLVAFEEKSADGLDIL